MADKQFIPSDTEQVWYKDSDIPGPTAVILGGIHGDELVGIAVVERIVAGEFKIPLEQGKLIVALGNLAAIAAKVHYINANLNRLFRDFTAEEFEQQATVPGPELSRAQALKPVLDEANASLDIHGFRKHDTPTHVFTEPRGFLAARSIGASYIISGCSSIEPGGTDAYMEAQGKIGLCYEASQQEDLRQGVPCGERGVLRFLEHLQLIESSAKIDQNEPTFIHATDAVVAKLGFRWGANFPYRSFQVLQAGELIARNGNTPADEIYAANDQVIFAVSPEELPEPDEAVFNIGNIMPSPFNPAA